MIRAQGASFKVQGEEGIRLTSAGPGVIIQATKFEWSSGTEVEKGATMVRVSAAWIIAAVIVLFTAAGNAQTSGAGRSGEGQEAISWEMYRQRQVEMQLEMQRQRLEMQQQQLDLQRQQLDLQRQRLELQRQQNQLEMERQNVERQKKKEDEE